MPSVGLVGSLIAILSLAETRALNLAALASRTAQAWEPMKTFELFETVRAGAWAECAFISTAFRHGISKAAATDEVGMGFATQSLSSRFHRLESFPQRPFQPRSKA